MGTRNTLKVIYNGKTVVSQYGQWDGYPTGQGAHVLRVLRDPHKMERLIRLFEADKICLVSPEEGQHILDMLKDVDTGIDGFNLSDALFYSMPISRDYGAGGVLEYLARAPGDIVYDSGKPILMIKDGDDLQEGNYVLDIVKEAGFPFDYILTMEYHGHVRKYTRAQVEEMVDSDNAMEVWEEEING